MRKDIGRDIPFEGNSMEDYLGMVFLPSEKEGTVIHAEMPVDHRTCQPFGVINGGASLALAETLAGHGSWELCREGEIPCGMQVTGNHVAPIRVGKKVHAAGRLIHRGTTTHIWDVDVTDADTDKLISSVRVVNYIIREK